MVYEWSVNLEDAGCGNNGIYFVSGSSHHSPLKDNGDDEDDNFPVPPEGDEIPFYDFGDLPDTYGTLLASDGAAHLLTVNSVYLGEVDPDMELDGQPSTSALGDDGATDGDEDGISRQVTTEWGNGESVSIDFNVQRPVTATATADVAMWIDWNGDGDFGDPGEYYLYENHGAPGTVTRGILVPGSDTYTSGASLSVRVRIVNDQADAPGGSFDADDYLGVATSGEVEDYVWEFTPTAVTLSRIQGVPGVNQLTVLGLLLGLTIVALRRPIQTVRAA